MKTFSTWKHRKVEFLAVPNHAGDGWHVVDEKGNNYGAWLSVDHFREKQRAADQLALTPLTGCNAVPAVRVLTGEDFRHFAASPCMAVSVFAAA